MRELWRRSGVYFDRGRAKRPGWLGLAYVRQSNLLIPPSQLFFCHISVQWYGAIVSFWSVVNLTQWLTAEVLGESAYAEFVKINRRQMRGFELLLKESAAELSTEESLCDFLSTTEDRYRIVKLSLRKLGHDDLVDALELRGRPPRGAMKKTVARRLMEHHPAAYMRLAAHILAFPCLPRSKAQPSGHATRVSAVEMARMVEYYRRSSNTTIYTACKLSVAALRRIHVVIDVMDLQAIYRERQPAFCDLATGRLQYFG